MTRNKSAYFNIMHSKKKLITCVLALRSNYGGTECTKCWMVSAGIATHASHSSCHSASRLLCFLFCTFRKRTSHRCSMGFRSERWADQYSTNTRECSRKAHTLRALWEGALSCWKTKACPSP